jgi:S1 RNA binding domain/Zc3h12a-like Ribonuclease NYN domain
MSRAASQTNNLVVVDGSNIATEGRATPSLAQLDEAVRSFCEEFPDINVTVVVDATFGHRIAKGEVAEFNKAVAHNELVAPPAGAVGRGDAFVLGIANKSGARILSNDSFQEFHGTYPWLFDEGRLIGGKPVPHVGWVFVIRLPVKGPVSRKARAAASSGGEPSRSGQGGAHRSRSASRAASQPMPVPMSPPPGAVTTPRTQPSSTKADAAKVVASAAAASPRGAPVNELIPFIDFVEHHPVGSSVTGVVESYSSHGAYVTIGDVRGYVPLRLMGNPPPRSAREVIKHGEAVTLVVDSFSPGRRNVDLALPGVVAAVPSAAAEEPEPPVPTKRTRARKAAAPQPSAEPAEAEAPKPPRATKKAAAKKADGAAKAATKAPAKKATAKAAAAAKPAKAAKTIEDAPAKSTRRSRSKKAVASTT